MLQKKKITSQTLTLSVVNQTDRLIKIYQTVLFFVYVAAGGITSAAAEAAGAG